MNRIGVPGDPAVIDGKGQRHDAHAEKHPAELLDVGLPRDAVARAVEVQQTRPHDERDEQRERPVEIEDEPPVDLHGRAFPAK